MTPTTTPDDPSEHKQLTVVPAEVTLSPDCPTLVRVSTDGSPDVGLSVSGSDLVEAYPHEATTGPDGTADIVIRGPLRNAVDAGPISVRIDAEGFGPAVLRVFGPSSNNPPLDLSGSPAKVIELGRPLFPNLAPGEFDDEPWPGFEPPSAAAAPDASHGITSTVDESDPPAQWHDDPYDGKGPPVELITTARCIASFVDCVSPNSNSVPQPIRLQTRFNGRMKVVVYPGSRWDTRGGRRMVQDQLDDAVDFFEEYCIQLQPRMVRIGQLRARQMDAWYRGWYARVLAKIGGVAQLKSLGKKTIPDPLPADFITSMTKLQVAAGNGLVVVFMNEYVGGKKTLVTSNQQNILQIGINFIDSRSPRILAHELVHALGKSAPNVVGPMSWNHRSGCKNAMTFIKRTNPRRPFSFADDRYLDIAEYKEIGTNRGAGVLRAVP